MIGRVNRFGKTFYGCTRYPTCNYVVNNKPSAKQCEVCGWKVMVLKQIGEKYVLECPNKACQHRMDMPDDWQQTEGNSSE